MPIIRCSIICTRRVTRRRGFIWKDAMRRTRAALAGTDMLQDTIAAISTPIGEAGLGVVRLSGADSLQIADACFKPVGENSAKPSEARTHTVHYGKMQRAGKVIDEVLLT